MQIRTMFVFVFVLLVAAVISSNSYSEDVNHYKLKFNDTKLNYVEVEALLYAEDDTLFMHPSCPNYDYPEGWSSFVEDLTITLNKNKIKPQYSGKSRWYVKGIAGNKSPLKVNYKVNLSFSKIKWDVGNEQSGLALDDVLYSVTKPFFIVNKRDIPAEVDFELPAGWIVTSPWKSSGNNVFLAGTIEKLIGNSVVVGKHEPFTVHSSGFTFEVVLLKNLQGDFAAFRSAVEKIAVTYIDMFGDKSGEKYMITLFKAEQDDGEAFKNSMSFSLKDPLNEENKIIWADQLAHEIFHYWNGNLIKHIDYAPSRWLHEGFTEYYANMILVRNKIISKEVFYQKASYMMGLYLFFKTWIYPDATLETAGEKRSGVYRFGIYNGGWTAAFALDMMLRSNSNGTKSLDDFMKLMYNKYGVTETQFSTIELIGNLNEIVKGDYQSFYENYIKGNKPIPIEEYLNYIGFKPNYVNYQGEFYLENTGNEQSIKNRNLWLNK